MKRLVLDVGSLRCLLPGGYTCGVGVSIPKALPLRPRRRRMVGSIEGWQTLSQCVPNSPVPPSSRELKG